MFTNIYESLHWISNCQHCMYFKFNKVFTILQFIISYTLQISLHSNLKKQHHAPQSWDNYEVWVYSGNNHTPTILGKTDLRNVIFVHYLKFNHIVIYIYQLDEQFYSTSSQYINRLERLMSCGSICTSTFDLAAPFSIVMDLALIWTHHDQNVDRFSSWIVPHWLGHKTRHLRKKDYVLNTKLLTVPSPY